MIRRVLLAVLLLTAGCKRFELYSPEVLVRPQVIGHGANFDLRYRGAEIADYRFMGAVRREDGSWEVRLDPIWLGIFNQESRVTVREGDVLPLGPTPAVNVEFVAIRPTELELRAVGVRALKPR